MRLQKKEIETPRLRLRHFRMEDAEDTYRNYCADPRVTKYLTWPTYTSLRDAEERMAFMQEQYEKGEVWDWAIELRELGQVIGGISAVHRDERTESVELGYCIGARWWHRGIMSEALGAVIDYLFTEGEVLRVTARHDPNNPNSGAVMRKCGMQYEGTLRRADRNNQGICDIAVYGILKEDWERGRRP